MVKVTPLMWCQVFVLVMFSKEIWLSWLYIFLYALIAFGYVQKPEFSWERVGMEAGALLAIAFLFTLVVGLFRLFSKDKL